jgi:hypothetical protein
MQSSDVVVPRRWWDFVKCKSPYETCQGQILALRSATSNGPDAETTFRGRWPPCRWSNPELSEQVSKQIPLEDSDEEGPPVLSPVSLGFQHGHNTIDLNIVKCFTQITAIPLLTAKTPDHL